MGWLCVLLVIALLLACPVVLCIRYEEKAQVKLRYLFFTYSLTDKKEKSVPKEKAKKKPSAKKQEGQPAPTKKEGVFTQMRQDDGVFGFLSFIVDLVRLSVGTVGKVLKHGYLSRYRIQIKLTGDDPAATAKLYGEVCAVLMPLSAFVLGKFRHERKASVIIDPDFMSESTQVYADLRFKVSVVFILSAAISALIKFISLRANNLSQGQNIQNIKKTGGVEHGRTCN